VSAQDLSKLKIDRSQTAPRSKRAWGKWLVLALVLAGIGFGAVQYRQRAPEVELGSVRLTYPAQSLTLLNATGYAVAQRKASLSSKASGRLEWLGVLEGSRVKQGELVARLENRDVAASLQLAEANLKLAQANLEQGQAELQEAQRVFARSQDLLNQKFISASSHDTAIARLARAKAAISGFQAAIAAARANRQVAQVALDQTLILAPFEGMILTKNANVGDNITPFSSAADSKGAVVTIADMSTLEVEADVSEASLGKIKVDQPCEIQFDAYPELRLAGVVARMVPTVDRAKATLLVKVKFIDHDPRVLPDMSAKVAFLSRTLTAQDKKPVLTVPAAAVTMRAGKSVLFAVQGDRVRQISVSSPPAGAEQVDVAGVPGLKVGDKIVLKPGQQLQDGASVRASADVAKPKA
jgi:RND family efflux transporter MFP subunit